MDQQTNEVTITYETLFELLRREKNREELQELSASFYDDVHVYLQDKIAILERPDTDLFASEEKERTRNQLKNIKKILKELYERREKKIIDIAIIKSRTQTNLIDLSKALPEEKVLYDDILSTLDLHHTRVMQVFEKRKPPTQDFVDAATLVSPAQHFPAHDVESTQDNEEEKGRSTLQQETPSLKPSQTKKVRFLSPTPAFLDKELKTHGPFSEGDESLLPDYIVDVLEKKGKVVAEE